jgi:type II secretory pathway pseudopilin PulG
MTHGEEEGHGMKRNGMLSGLSKHSIARTSQKTARVALTSGSSLVWVMVVILVLVIVLGVGLTAVSRQFALSAMHHEQQQAYYTALSAVDTVSRWIASGSEQGSSQQQDVEKLLAAIKTNTSDGVNYPLEGLVDGLGACSLRFKYTDTEMTTLQLTATATFANATETISLTMQQGENTITGKDLPVANYNLAIYDTRAAQDNALKTTGIVALYDPDLRDNVPFNQQDRTTLNSLISVNSTYEARWTNVNLTSPTVTYNDTILGTQRYPINGSDGSTIDTRRFVVPQNGRITIDPLEGNSKSSPANTAGEADNTKIVSLAIDNTAGKNVRLRLASNGAATKAKILNMSGTFYNRSQDRWASLLMFDFTDNAGNTATEKYTLNGSEKTYTWHPNNWNNMDAYLPTDGEVTSNLILGPFGHKYNTDLDFYGRGNFVDNWNGVRVGELKEQWPYILLDSHHDDQGLPVFPLDYGKGAGFWILDQRPDRYFRVIQGANIIRGTIYSTRPTIVGGALIRAANKSGSVIDGYTTDNLNNAVYGFANTNPASTVSYVEATTRFSQMIFNTDIILKAPSSGTANSLIRRPDTWRDRKDTNRVTAHEKTYEPTMTIKSGTIYVGERQSLTIQGATLDNMWISPDYILVTKGGSLTIQASSYTNIFTDIYVDGGALNIETGARIKGNIYAYNEGTVNVKGSFTLLSPHDDGKNNVLSEAEAKDGIHIYGSQLVGKIEGVSQPGTLILPATSPTSVVISGSSNKVHMLGTVNKTTLNNPSRQPFAAATVEAIKKTLLCNDRDSTSGACRHFGFLGGGWTAGTYSRE